MEVQEDEVQFLLGILTRLVFSETLRKIVEKKDSLSFRYIMIVRNWVKNIQTFIEVLFAKNYL